MKLSFFHWIARAGFNSLKHNPLRSCYAVSQRDSAPSGIPRKKNQNLLKQWPLIFWLETMSSEARQQAKMNTCIPFYTACTFPLALCFSKKLQAVKAVL
jgi:hypothetical protein